jgi:chromosome segregation ATPase
MSDPNKFINTYIDTTIATLHEYVGSSLQLKTQLKLANDLLLERDAAISKLTDEKDAVISKLTDEKDVELARLTGELESINNNFSATQDNTETMKAALLSCQDKLRIAEESHSAISSKVSHMDTLLKQLSDMKNEIRTRDDQISSLNTDLAAKDNQIASLNTDIVTKDTQILSCNEKVNNLTSALTDKDKLISELTKKLEKLTPPPPVPKTDVAKNVKESSTVKVQLNTKTKTKEPDDDF